MRMTRAALRAQAQGLDEAGREHEHESQQESQSQPVIHEDVDADPDTTNHSDAGEGEGEDRVDESAPLRPVLKDITHENNLVMEEQNVMETENEKNVTTKNDDIPPEVSESAVDNGPEEEQVAPAPAKKGRGKRKAKQGKKGRRKDEEHDEGEENDLDVEVVHAANDTSCPETVAEETSTSTQDVTPCSLGADQSGEVAEHSLVELSSKENETKETRGFSRNELGETLGVSSEKDLDDTDVPHETDLQEEAQHECEATETDSADMNVQLEMTITPSVVEAEVAKQSSVDDVLAIHAPAEEERTHLNETTFHSQDTVEDSISTPRHIRTDPPKTPKFDPSIHAPFETISTPPADSVEDSFVDKIKSRSPSKMQLQFEATTSDGFDEDIMTHTPRIEDSVDAIDALEDAIEKVSENLPVLEGLQLESPVKSRKITPARQPAQITIPAPSITTTKKTTATPTKSKSPQTKATAVVKTTTTTGQTKSTTARPQAPKVASTKISTTSTVTRQTKKPIIDGTKPRASTALGSSSRPALSFSNSPAKTTAALPNTSEKRIPSTGSSGTSLNTAKSRLSTNKPAFVPAKSSKPPTKPTFTLPGEAISAKLKAQREERLKREEEAEKERKQFKARPVPSKVARPSVLPRETKASQARMSIYANGVDKENVAPQQRVSSSSSSSSSSSTGTKPRPSSTAAKVRVSSVEHPAKVANSSVRRTTAVGASSVVVVERTRPTRPTTSVGENKTGVTTTAVTRGTATTTAATATAASKPRVSSLTLTAGQKQTVTKEDVAQQKAKGREVFGRTKIEMERAEKEKREKEDAAKRARAEAAERGRQASREWAERQKKKLALQAQAAAKMASATATGGQNNTVQDQPFTAVGAAVGTA
ncbi:hypothetical protein HRR83_000401 [Exophiala dermatitidis]|uniref:Uncharacterized protein n=1 Tax=Exophiala dermatitidis TaxID=5970 RepID=A0AAN6F2R6_EXODE|nr:hypothetical protein HRR75_000364 [Exophiala dermatitidis]KAJ4527648.1 hypothetical protein HRR74_000403 [Exophiala dermatitidis]KAJ4528284.1 hypothetical protein HRR73_000907 [Exophiala dermatitidis]KAJ4531227.1 hypothetical protein HRR76_008899 [Exophiala dermatitidis]KAJ4539033.1 hypothetical protein HRR78_007958 [Exophiala dermatitidis]